MKSETKQEILNRISRNGFVPKNNTVGDMLLQNQKQIHKVQMHPAPDHTFRKMVATAGRSFLFGTRAQPFLEPLTLLFRILDTLGFP